ncbi:MAG: MYXO-CTERM sorting domain-containing protein [Kofleriaceae bacterium]
MKSTTNHVTNRFAVAGVLGAAFAVSLAACQTSDEPRLEQATSASFVNGDFETGTAGQAPPSWNVLTNLNPGFTPSTPQTYANLNLGAGGTARTKIMAGTNQPNSHLGAAGSLRYCRYGSQCTLVNDSGKDKNVNTLRQTMTLSSSDIDPVDGQYHVRFVYAPVLENPNHATHEQPYYMIQLTNVTQGKLVYSDFNLAGATGVNWKKIVTGGTEYSYTDWILVDVSSATGALAAGDQVRLDVIAAGCSLGGHFGEVYVDGVGAVLPGISIGGTGPSWVNPGETITYDLTYRNGSANEEDGVVIEFKTPPGTTFQGYTPPPGATCVTPPIGGTGTIVCTFASPVPAGALASFTVTVKVDPSETGPIVCGQYDIRSSTESRLTGNKIVTDVGCAADADCTGGQWCNISARTCTDKLPNSTSLPTDPPHANPTLDGTCTAPAATLVCESAVCDASDDKCGYANGNGACNAANAGTVCRSSVCDPLDLHCGYANGNGTCTDANAGVVCRSSVCDPTDQKCGYSNGEGSCTAANAGTVCRSGACSPGDQQCGYDTAEGPCDAANATTVCRSGMCSQNGTCLPPGGCLVDADCSGGLWCNQTQQLCVPKLENGQPVPTDPPHSGPTLDGTCTEAAAELVCVSGVCDTRDDQCGYADGGGTCTAANADVVCRSGECSENGMCMPAGGCLVDADCSGGDWCNQQQRVCTPKLPNGEPMPTDPPHTNPTLDGTCTPEAAPLVCASGVCDTRDDKCGYADGGGTCTPADEDVVCRSGECSENGMCMPAGGCLVDADCADDKWCNMQARVCTPRFPNGDPLPTDPPHTNPTLDGGCTAEAAVLVCESGVCDTQDDKCGFGNGTGPCTSTNAADVCRSGTCGADGACGLADGVGPCTSEDGSTVCRSGVCNAFGTCGPRQVTVEGGGGCSAAGGAGGNAAVFALAALVLRRRRRAPRA